MKLSDSRRLTGPNLLLDTAGAVLELDLTDGGAAGPIEAAAAIEAWRGQVGRILGAIGWSGAAIAHRAHRGGLTLAMSAPMDVLYAATEVNEWAWQAAEAEFEGRRPPSLDEAAERLLGLIHEERDPALLALRVAAREHGVSFLSDDDRVSVGLGAGSMTWPTDDLPRDDQVGWERVFDIPVAMVTGTNGKTTTVRLLASMATAAGRVAGSCSTDWIRVGGEVVEKGDYSGPGGARQVLRDRRVEVAILETARGGILRRGLSTERVDAALVTNIAEDHLGESGIWDLEELAQAKLVVHKVARRMVLNADDPLLVRHGSLIDRPTTWFGRREEGGFLARHLSAGGTACWTDDEALYLGTGTEATLVALIRSIPMTLGGAARHNVENALAAVGVASSLELPLDAVRTALEAFDSNSEANPGRLNRFDLGGLAVIVDFAHNPHGMAALLEMAAALPANRRLVSTGQGGDRDDGSVRRLARTIAAARPDRILVKELWKYLRGRQPGEVPGIIVDELLAAGLSTEAIGRSDSEMDSVRQALAWGREDDLALLIIHSQRSSVVSYLERLQAGGWRPGEPVPGP